MTVARRKKGQHGFSLIELLIVVGIILVLAALAIPTLLRAKISANEASAVSAVRTIHSAQLQYQSYYPTIGFADDIAKLGPPPTGTAPSPTQANLLDFVLGCATQPCAKSGYQFMVDQVSGSPVTGFRITAVPLTPGRTGNRGFCSTEPGVITADPAGGTSCSIPIT